MPTSNQMTAGIWGSLLLARGTRSGWMPGGAVCLRCLGTLSPVAPVSRLVLFTIGRQALDGRGFRQRGPLGFPGPGRKGYVVSRGFAVNSRGVRVPAGVREVVDVRFDGERIWSFNPRREQTRPGQRWVRWPRDLEPYLDGVAEVSLVAHVSGERVLEERVGFGTGTSPIRLVDKDGHAVALDKAGHLQRMFAGTDPSMTEAVLDAVERVLLDLREECGLDAFLAFGCLLGAVRDGHVIGHDCDADVSYLSQHTHPFDIIRENKRAADTMESLGWQITRMSAGDFKIWTRPGGGRRVGIDVFAAFYVDGEFHMVPSVDRRPGPVRSSPRRRGDARGPALRRPGPTRGPAGGDLRTRLAGARPVVRVRPLARDPPAPERLAAQQPQEPALLGRLLPVATERPGADHARVRSRPGWPTGSSRGSTSSTSGAGTGATRSTSPGGAIGSPRWTAPCWRAA